MSYDNSFASRTCTSGLLPFPLEASSRQFRTIIPKSLKFQFQDRANPSIAPLMLTDKDNLLRRLHALRSEHRDLDTVIARITEHGPLDQLQIQRLKKRKLGLKDEIAWVESRLIPDRSA
jgi:hypothetical protein